MTRSSRLSRSTGPSSGKMTTRHPPQANDWKVVSPFEVARAEPLLFSIALR